MADRYWVGAAGNWSDTAKWSTTSGGAGGASVPGVGDNAIFTALSDSGANFTATVDASVTVDNLTFTSVDRLITLGTAENLTVTGATAITATSTTFGVLVSGNASLGAVTLSSGTLNINGNTVTMRTFTSITGTRTLNFGTNGVVILTGNNTTIWNITTVGVSSITGTGIVDCTYAGGSGKRQVANTPDSGNTNCGFKVSAGTDEFNFTVAQSMRSLDFTGFAGRFTGSSALTITGNFTCDAAMTYSSTSRVLFTGTSILTSAGKVMDDVTLNSGSVTLGDALTCAALSVTGTNSTLNTANYNLTAESIASSATATRTISFGSSTVTLTAALGVSFTNTGTLNFNAGTSQINLTNSLASLAGLGKTFYNVSFTSTAVGGRNISGANTFNNLTLGASATGLSQLNVSDDQIVNGTFTCSGSSPTQRAAVISSAIGTARTITAASVSANDCDFRDITIAGAAAPISPTRAGDCGGNSGITFPTAKTVYRVGTDTTWQGASSWALSSGGTGSDDNFPLAQDTAIIDDNTTLTGTLSLVNYSIGPVDFSTRTTGITFSNAVSATFYGSYILSSSVTLTGTAAQTFSGRGTMVFTCAGKTVAYQLSLDAPGGVFQLGSAYNSSGQFIFVRGTVDANDYNFTTTIFNASNSNVRTVTMGSGLWTVTATGTPWNLATVTNLTFNKGTANILIPHTSTTAKTFAGGGLSYNKLTIQPTSTATTTISGTNSFTELSSINTRAHTIRFSNDQGTIDIWSVNGSTGNVVTVDSSVSGTRRTFNLTNVTSGINYLSVKDIGVNQTNRFYVGTNSTDGGNNVNVYFTDPATPSNGSMFMLFN